MHTVAVPHMEESEAVVTKEELLKTIERAVDFHDPERAHVDAEKALLQYVNDNEITDAWERAAELWWYA